LLLYQRSVCVDANVYVLQRSSASERRWCRLQFIVSFDALLDVIRPSVVLCWDACTQVPRCAYSQNLHLMSAVNGQARLTGNMPAEFKHNGCLQVSELSCRRPTDDRRHGGTPPPMPSSASLWGRRVSGYVFYVTCCRAKAPSAQLLPDVLFWPTQLVLQRRSAPSPLLSQE
jgi:hypothetical protein